MPEQYYIAKVFRQHNSLVIVVPGVVCVALGIKAGQHVVFAWTMKDGDFKFTKFKPVGAKDERHGTDTDKPDQGG